LLILVYINLAVHCLFILVHGAITTFDFNKVLVNVEINID